MLLLIQRRAAGNIGGGTKKGAERRAGSRGFFANETSRVRRADPILHRRRKEQLFTEISLDGFHKIKYKLITHRIKCGRGWL